MDSSGNFSPAKLKTPFIAPNLLTFCRSFKFRMSPCMNGTDASICVLELERKLSRAITGSPVLVKYFLDIRII